MPILPAISTALIGYAAIFICMGFALFFLRSSAERQPGPGYWSLSFMLSAIGYVLWSNAANPVIKNAFAVGDAFNVAALVALLYGIYRYVGNRFRWQMAAYALGIAVVWVGDMSLIAQGCTAGFVLFSVLRSLLSLSGSVLLFRGIPSTSKVGRPLAGWTLFGWGLYVLIVPLVMHTPRALSVALGLLVGLRLLAVVGLVILMMDTLRTRVEENEQRANYLEVLLPVCSYCKRIRDEKGEWRAIEDYMNKYSMAKFSHGICPECAQKQFPKLGLFPKKPM